MLRILSKSSRNTCPSAGRPAPVNRPLGAGAVLLLAVSLFASAVLAGGGGARAAGEEPVLNVAFVWHQHQPLYTDPVTGEVQLPWVRMHAIKDYYDMVAMYKQYPDLRATFNLVPSLIDQIDAYTGGERIDAYQKAAAVPAEELDDETKRFLLERFFDANWDNVIGRFPRYKELLDKRGASADDESIRTAMGRYTVQDFRDLQVWFDLAWFDPDFLTNDPDLAALVRRGRDFTEADKALIHEKQVDIMGRVIDIHKEVQQAGQIELMTTPYSHPILPLLYDTDLARVASPDLDLPGLRFAWPEDIERHLQLALDNYEANFGGRPKGLWPSEQAVSKHIVPAVARAGFEWIISSEGVLENTLGLQLRGIGGTVVRPDLLYQAYWAEHEGERVAILFRDIVLSDRVGFEYSGMRGRAAADDLLAYLHRARRLLGKDAGEKVVVIALDGENAWEHYENDGKEFFHALYEGLSSDPLLRTVTVSEYLAEHPPTAVLDDLWTGSWIGSDLETWIGEAEENIAWDQLALARDVLARYEAEHGDDSAHGDAIAAAWKAMIAAQGSDWFWWYGDDQDSGNDEAFDRLYRAHLQGVYDSLGMEAPRRLSMPLLAPRPAQPRRPVTALTAPMADGWADFGEWDGAGLYEPRAGEEGLLKALYVAVDYQHMTVRVDFQEQARQLIGRPLDLLLYLDRPGSGPTNEETRFGGSDEMGGLGYPLAYEVRLDLAGAPTGVRPTVEVSKATGEADSEAGGPGSGDSGWRPVTTLRQLGLGGTFEARIPFEQLGYEPGDAVRLTAVLAVEGADAERLPWDGPAVVHVPRPTEGTLVFRMEDPEGDDYGPGTYTYPTNEVFPPGVFDLTEFEVYETESDVVFHVQFAGPIDNVWNSPNGLSVQTVDIYIDTDRVPGSGSTEALAGRRVRVAPESAWEYAVWVEGWNEKLFTADGTETNANVRAVTDPIHRRLTIQVPKSAVGEPEPHWGYIVLAMGQEGFPASDSLRVREVMAVAQEWRFGGGHDGAFDPNVIDMLAAPGEQEEMLSAYDPRAGVMAEVRAVYGDEAGAE